MAIFSGIEMLFFWLGFLLMGAIAGITVLARRYKFNWKAWLLVVTGLFLGFFALAWSISSALEGESHAATIGMVMFGVPGVVLIVLAGRFVEARTPEPQA